ncbi:MAG: hypothetical protein P4L84_37895 [Isosphaeraceae bacterium]|nr:hypothetical protein [Isosphaeraceae bacterium]
MALDTAIVELVIGVTKPWAKQRKAEERKVSAEFRRRYIFHRSRVTLKEAAAEIMEWAYLKASAQDSLPAHARQVFYPARPLIEERTGKLLKDNYFTQTLLPDYIEDNNLDWDVVFDARGQFTEPHTGTRVPLGTLAVRGYLADIEDHEVSDPAAMAIPSAYPTKGPANRYGRVLVLEKEGFDEILAATDLGNRFDVAVASTKGLSVTAYRRLIEQLGVPVYVLHDFDQAGFSILGTLRRSTRRYRFKRQVEVIDLGLTLDDIEHYKLKFETQELTHKPTTLRRNGATDADIAFLQKNQRVELNALSSDQLIELIEKKLTENGVEKVIPDLQVLAAAYRRACQVTLLNRVIAAAGEKTRVQAAAMILPDDLAGEVRARLKLNPKIPWDKAVADMAIEGVDKDPS